ncbi:MAG TPA: hypothetical protein VIV57_25140 [Anaeromyxobacter sp.]
MTCLITAAFVIAFIAAEYFAIQQREQDAERERARLGEGAQPGLLSPGFSPAPRATSDEVVHELEHRIDEELRDISYAMCAPERYKQIFDA